MEATSDILFDELGNLEGSKFEQESIDILLAIQAFLSDIKREMFLPLDLLYMLVEKGDEKLRDAVLHSNPDALHVDEVASRLRVLAVEIEENDALFSEAKTLNRNHFSKGFIRILRDANTIANGKAIARKHIVDVLLWRVDSIESASVKWAIRRLGEGAGNLLFGKNGNLQTSLYDETTCYFLEFSGKIAAENGTPFLGTPHLLAALCSIPQTIIWRAAKVCGIQPERLRDELLRLIGGKVPSIPVFKIGRKTLTPRMVRMLSAAHRGSSEKIDETALTQAFINDGGSSLELIQALGLESEIRRLLGDPKVLEVAIPMEAAIHFGKKTATPTLDLLGRDLTAEAFEGKLPLIVGRERELHRMINILLRKEQRNPLLTGEAGVGKTALAVALAQRIASAEVPSQLHGYRVVEINGASLMSGTSYRGDLEARIKGLLEEASEKVILFIDEAHAVFSPKSGSNSPAEVPNYFKSALASGDIAVVGATTESEYRRWIEQDPALKRRFEKIDIVEPNDELVQQILGKLVGSLESDYDVEVSPEAVQAAIRFSVQFVPEQRLPDKAKKLLMDACIACANNLTNVNGKDEGTNEKGRRVVTVLHVAEQVVFKTGIPLERVVKGQVDWWVGLEETLNAAVIGQKGPIKEIAKTLIRNRLKGSFSARPLGVFLFHGPAGVGKSLVAKILAEVLFGDVKALLRINMADFHQVHSLNRLIGAPPGYVGYEDEDLLVTPLRRRPSTLVYLDDFDRAHPVVQDRILRIIEEGQIRDTRGYAAEISNTIFVFSIQNESDSQGSIGFGEKSKDGPRLAEEFSGLSDFVDAAIEFGALRSAETSKALFNSYVEKFKTALFEEYQVRLQIDPITYSELEKRALTMVGAKGIETLVEEMLLNPTTELLLGSRKPKEISLTWANDSVVTTLIE